MRPDELESFFKALDKNKNSDFSDYVYLSLFTAEGTTFCKYLRENRNDQKALTNLLFEFQNILLALKAKGIAHGDLQHDNILVSNGRRLLVHYDGLYLPSLESFKHHELGHPNYQHPARSANHYGPYLDNFSGWLIQFGLEYLIQDTQTIERIDEDSLLVKRNDLISPHTSNCLFRLEAEDGPAKVFSRRIRTLVQMPLEEIPYIDQQVDVDAGLPDIMPAGNMILCACAQSAGDSQSLNLQHLQQEVPCKWERETGNHCHRCVNAIQQGNETPPEEKNARFFCRILGLAVMYLFYFFISGMVSRNEFSWNFIPSALILAAAEAVFGGCTILAILLSNASFCDGRYSWGVILLNLLAYWWWKWCPYAYYPVQRLIQDPGWWLTRS